MLQLLLLIPICAFLDRLCGGWPPVPGRGVYYALPILTAAGYLLGIGWPMGLALAIGFAVWRSPSWHTLGGDLDPDPKQYPGTLARHSLAPIALIAAIYIAPAAAVLWDALLQSLALESLGPLIAVAPPFHPQTLILLAFPPVALLLAIQKRKSDERGKDINWKIEDIRGAVLGALMAGAVWPIS